ncbi:polysaccharide biosynthesis/export family protein [uncultured Fibrobacter sp.]|jgi:polysaccharide export outer membrane protein|uniref:polysaccharide biosynthesis/export family protein n=1 Tax=uncultured Fibrobacter sp. TaxID=261512 RepID=UPI002635FC16|nr:polysaccharide biosynthesis/export family protein [uncultured Fibrobacter sp.]
MKKVVLGLCAGAAAVLSGCALGPQMRMSLPDDAAEYNGMKVFVHNIDAGEMENAVASADGSDSQGDLKDLLVDSLPALEYRIGPLDMVQVVVWEHPELTSPMGQYQPAGQKVTTDGKLFYPYAGELQAAGLTAQELRAEITKRLSDKILNDPQVDVRVTGYNSRKAFVAGAVAKPGFISFNENPMTLPDAIANVGGFSNVADASAMQLRRGEKIYNINYLDAFKSNLPLERLVVQPNDQIFVPSLTETQKDQKVYVMGEVAKSGIVNIYNGNLTLAEALAAAGGLQAVNATSRGVYVIRNTSEKQIDVFQLNSKNAMALAMADRFKLSSRDVVYVDASDLATWNRMISLILPSVQTVYYGALTAHHIHVAKDDYFSDDKK